MSTTEEVDIDFFITLVQEREIIWDKSHIDFKNKNLKTKAWEQISKDLFPDYDNFTHERKNKVGNDLVKKWRSIKDNFFRYLKKIKETSKSGSGATNLKKYHLYNQLLFLRKVQQNDTDSSLDSPREINTESTSINESTIDESPRYVPITRKRSIQMDDFEREGLKILKEPENRHMSFFRGILPSIQDFSDRQTLTFQSKVLQIIGEIRYGQTSSYVCGPSTSQQPLSYGYQTTNFQSTYNSDYNSSITSLEQASQDSQASEETEYDFSNI